MSLSDGARAVRFAILDSAACFCRITGVTVTGTRKPAPVMRRVAGTNASRRWTTQLCLYAGAAATFHTEHAGDISAPAVIQRKTCPVAVSAESTKKLEKAGEETR